ncbi:MAG: DUF1214 domain-containing protein [Planctomycetota bacterium]
MKPAVFLIAIVPTLSHAFGQALDEQASRRKAEYDYTYATALNAAVYGWAPVIMDVSMKLQTSVDAPADNGQAPINQFGPITRLWDYRDRSYATPNNDTVYLQAWIDVEEQPMVLYVPPMESRYWIEQVLDMYTESVVDLCDSTVGSEGGYFVLAKRGWKGEISDDLPVYYSRTRFMWLAGRIGVPDPEDISLELDLQKRFRLMPLDQYPDGGKQPTPEKAVGAPTVKFPEGVDFFVRLDRILSENPLPEDAPMVDTFKSIGIGSGGVEDLTDNQKSALVAAHKDAFNVVFDAAKNTGTPVNGWNWEFEAGRYRTDYLLRAAVNMNSVGLNSPERAMYPKRYVDSDGQRLHGKHAYTLTMPAKVPIRGDNGGFWSITMYDAEDRFMVENELKRYKIGTVTDGLKRNNDGSLTIYFSHEKPADASRLTNWLPAPDDFFMLQCRLYEPEESVVKGEFKLPEMDRIE